MLFSLSSKVLPFSDKKKKVLSSGVLSIDNIRVPSQCKEILVTNGKYFNIIYTHKFEGRNLFFQKVEKTKKINLVSFKNVLDYQCFWDIFIGYNFYKYTENTFWDWKLVKKVMKPRFELLYDDKGEHYFDEYDREEGSRILDVLCDFVNKVPEVEVTGGSTKDLDILSNIFFNVFCKHENYIIDSPEFEYRMSFFGNLINTFPGVGERKRYVDLLSIPEYKDFLIWLKSNWKYIFPDFPYDISNYLLYLYIQERIFKYSKHGHVILTHTHLSNIDISLFLQDKESLLKFYNSLLLIKQEFNKSGLEKMLNKINCDEGFVPIAFDCKKKYKTVMETYFSILEENILNILNNNV